MSLRLVLLAFVGVLASGQNTTNTNTGDTSLNGIRCCEPRLGPCTPGLPLCSDIISSMLTPSPSPAGCCNPLKTQCTSTMNICPSSTMTPGPTLKSPDESGQCCDPTVTNCLSSTTLCPSASMTSMPSQRPVLSVSETGKPITEPTSSASITGKPSNTPSTCCDPTRMTCDSRQTICGSVSSAPTMIPSLPPIPSDACCDPLKFPCPDFVPRCPPGGGTGLPSIPPDVCCGGGDVSLPGLMCPSFAPPCQTKTTSSASARPTNRPIPSTLTECCDPLKYKCLLGMILCRPLSSQLPSLPIDTSSSNIAEPVCCDPMVARCVSTAIICPSQRPVFSKKPSPILPRPTQYINFQLDSVLAAGSMRSTPSAAPSRWPIRNPVNLTALGLPRPEALVSRIGFGSANVTELLKPAKLQELQIQLGCTFRMPLENIRITNITVFDVLADKLRIVPFDITLVNQHSNGQIVCLPVKNGSRVLRGRELQTSGSGSTNENINVEYAILDPSDDILSLDDAEFNTVLASSTLNDFQVSIGGGATAAIISVPSVASPTPAMTSSTDNGSEARMRIGLGIGLGIVGFVAIVAVGALVYKRRNPIRRRPTGSVHVIFTSNSNSTNPFAKHANNVSNRLESSDRRIFNPIGSRV